MSKNRLDVIKGTPYLFNCDVTRSDFLYIVNKLDKLHKDLIQMVKLSNCKYVDIEYVLNAIESERY